MRSGGWESLTAVPFTPPSELQGPVFPSKLWKRSEVGVLTKGVRTMES